ncbi:MAG: hypothetical protein PHQ23_15660, partial [Candidatus Wallbacteria bacterium]|nr:hypothetical protein [Candidatus Wallbacteria bacterium]
KYFQYHQGGPAPNTVMLDEYGGIAVWNYPGDGKFPNNAKPDAVTAKNDIDDKGICINGTQVANTDSYQPNTVPNGMDVNGDGAVDCDDYPYNAFDAPKSNYDGKSGIFGTTTFDAGAGGNDLNEKDWKSITYHWFVGAYIYDTNAEQCRWYKSEVKTGTLDDRSVCVTRVNTDTQPKSVIDGEEIVPDFARRRIYHVKLQLDKDDLFRFAMPLSPTTSVPLDKSEFYYVWVEFDYPVCTWEPRDLHPMNPDDPKETVMIPSYYDLVRKEDGHDSYRDISYDPLAGGTGVPQDKGYKVRIVDREGPVLIYREEGGAYPEGATTADMFPRRIEYTLRDNNPNCALLPDYFALRIQLKNPSIVAGKWDNEKYPLSEYHRYAHNSESTLNYDTDLSSQPEGSSPKPQQVMQTLFDRVLKPDNHNNAVSRYYYLFGQMDEDNIHRYLDIFHAKRSVGPMPENFDNTIYWYVEGRDKNGNLLNDKIPPVNPGPKENYWRHLGTVSMHDNDPPEVSFVVTIPKLGREIKYQVSDDGRDDIMYDAPQYGFVNDGGNTEIDRSTTPDQTALVDYTVWGNGTLLPLNNEGGTTRGKIYIIVTGNGSRGEPQLGKQHIFDYCGDGGQGADSFNMIETDLAGCIDGTNFLDFGALLQKRRASPAIPAILGLDEDMRIGFELRARDNVDHICPQQSNNKSHNLTQNHDGDFPVTLMKNLKPVVVKTAEFGQGWGASPSVNINIGTDEYNYLHAVHFAQFRESTNIPLESPDSEWFEIEVTDKAGNLRSFKIPFRILDTTLLDELLKRQKEQIRFLDSQSEVE